MFGISKGADDGLTLGADDGPANGKVLGDNDRELL